MMDNEQVLLRRFSQSRDALAFCELVEGHKNMVFAACRRVLGNQADAEDAAQDCFLKLAEAAGRLKAPISGWLHTVAVRSSIDILRSETARKTRERSVAKPDVDATDAPWANIESDVDAALESLSKRLRMPIVLRFLEGRTQEEVAAALGVSRRTVATRLDRGIEILRRRLKRTGVAAPAVALTAMLSVTAAEAAPAALTATLGKVALAGASGGKIAAATGGTFLTLKTAAALVVAAGAGAGALAIHQAVKAPHPTPLAAAAPAPAPVPAEDDPASVLPANALVVVRLEKAGAQRLLSTAALPPIAKMVAPQMVSPFAYVNEMLKLAPGTAEKAAPHVTGAAFALLPGRDPGVRIPGPDIHRDPVAVFVVSFDDDQWPRELQTQLLKELKNLGDPLEHHRFFAAGKHIVCTSKAGNGMLGMLLADTPKLAASPHYQAARKQAAGSMLWAVTSVPELLKTARADIERRGERDMRRTLDGFTSLLGLDHMTYALLAIRGAGTTGTLELTIGLDGKPSTSILGLLPTGKIAGTAKAPADAAATFALNWGDAQKFFGGVRDQLLATTQEVGRPGEARQLEVAVAGVEAVLGLPLDGLFAHLGGGVSAFLLPPDEQGMIGRQDWAAVLPLKKPDAFRTVLHNATKMFMRVPAVAGEPPVPGNPPPHDAILSVPGAPIFYTVTPEALVLAGSQANVKRAIALKKVPTKSAAMLRLDGKRLLQSYGKPKDDPLTLSINLARTPKQLKLTARIEGVPRGNTALLLGAAPAVMAGLLMPALSSAGDQANRAADRANLSQIAKAIAAYTVDNKGEYPPNLKALFGKYLQNPAVLVSRGDKNPPLVNGMECSYLYVGTPFPKNAPDDVIICHTRPGVFNDGHNVAFVDGAVMWAAHVVPRMMGLGNPRRNDEFEAVVKLLGPALTKARKGELAIFYDAPLAVGQPADGFPPRADPPDGGGEREFPVPPDR